MNDGVIERIAEAIQTGRQNGFPDSHTATVVASVLLEDMQRIIHTRPPRKDMAEAYALAIGVGPPTSQTAPEPEAAQAAGTGPEARTIEPPQIPDDWWDYDEAERQKAQKRPK